MRYVGLALLCLVVAILFSIVAAGMWVANTYNTANSLETQFQASLQSREILYDNMAKQIQEKFAVAKFERSTVIQLIDGAVAGRDGGQMFKSVQEQYPQVSPELFREVMATIGGKRDEFTRSQQQLAQISAEHTNMRINWPSSMIVGSRNALTFKIVSSDDAKNAMTTGTDNNILINEKP